MKHAWTLFFCLTTIMVSSPETVSAGVAGNSFTGSVRPLFFGEPISARFEFEQNGDFVMIQYPPGYPNGVAFPGTWSEQDFGFFSLWEAEIDGFDDAISGPRVVGIQVFVFFSGVLTEFGFPSYWLSGLQELNFE